MAKRFTDTLKWTNNKWFFNLPLEIKLFWIYLLDSCDAVGVWEENIELANRIIGYQYSIDTLLIAFEKQIHVFKDNRKWWIVDFCNFQYGLLKEDSVSKPHISYIKLLKKHNLWDEYVKGIITLKEKETEKDGDIKKDKIDKEESIMDFYRGEFLKSKGKKFEKSYYRFVGTIFNTEEYKNKLDEIALHITEVDKQLEFDQFVKLSLEAKKRGVVLLDFLDSMINNPKYVKGKKSLYLTFENWLKRTPIRGTNL